MESAAEKDIVERALAFAAAAHAGQVRKSSGVPYIVHPAEVAAICAYLTSDREVIAAAALHDTVEDCGVSPSEIRARFGARVAQIVAAESEDKMRDLPAGATWRERKQAAIERIERTRDVDVLRVCLADKLSNLRSLRHEQELRGRVPWECFNMSDPRQQQWSFRSVADALRPALGDTLEWQELDRLIDEVFSPSC